MISNKLIAFVVLLFLFYLVAANSTEIDNSSEDVFNETLSLDENLTIIDDNVSVSPENETNITVDENLTTINDNVSIDLENETNIMVDENLTFDNITNNVTNGTFVDTNDTSTNQTIELLINETVFLNESTNVSNFTILYEIFDFVISTFVEGGVYSFNLFEFLLGTGAGVGDYYSASIILDRPVTPNSKSIGSVYIANIGGYLPVIEPTVLYCGDGFCQSGEDCDSCSADCGVCPTPVVTPSVGGGRSIECRQDSDCDLGEFCSDNRCYAYECETDADCNDTKTCWMNRCVKLFDMKIIEVPSSIYSGEFFNFIYYIKGVAAIHGDVVVRFWIVKDGEVVTEGFDTIYMADFEEKTESAKLFLPVNIESGAYNFYAEVNYDSYYARAGRMIDISLRPLELFDIRMNLEDSSLESSSDLIAIVVYESFGTIPSKVDLKFEIFSEDGDLVYYRDDFIVVEVEEVRRYDFSDLDLFDGSYELVLITEYGDGVRDEFRQKFRVGKKVSLLDYWWVFFVVLILVIFIIFIRRKKSKEDLLIKEEHKFIPRAFLGEKMEEEDYVPVGRDFSEVSFDTRKLGFDSWVFSIKRGFLSLFEKVKVGFYWLKNNFVFGFRKFFRREKGREKGKERVGFFERINVGIDRWKRNYVLMKKRRDERRLKKKDREVDEKRKLELIRLRDEKVERLRLKRERERRKKRFLLMKRRFVSFLRMIKSFIIDFFERIKVRIDKWKENYVLMKKRCNERRLMKKRRFMKEKKRLRLLEIKRKQKERNILISKKIKERESSYRLMMLGKIKKQVEKMERKEGGISSFFNFFKKFKKFFRFTRRGRRVEKDLRIEKIKNGFNGH
jgi:hypothetical protein